MVIINTVLPVRSKSCVKIQASRFSELLESISCIQLVVEFFPAKSCQDAWRSDNQLVRGQENMADEVKLCSPSRSTSEALVVWGAVRCGHREELDPFCWPVPAVGIVVFCASHWFAEHASQIQWVHQDSHSCSVSDQQQATKQRPWPFFFFFWCRFGFGKCSGASSQTNH